MSIYKTAVYPKIFNALILLISLLVFSACPGIQSTDKGKTKKVIPVEQPTPEPEEHMPSPGDVWISPILTSVKLGDDFITKVYIQTGSKSLHAYGIDLTFDDSIISVDAEKGKDGVEAGADGFLATVNAKGTPLKTSGFAADKNVAIPVMTHAHLLTVHWKTHKTGSCEIGIIIRDAAASDISDVSCKGFGAYVTVSP